MAGICRGTVRVFPKNINVLFLKRNEIGYKANSHWLQPCSSFSLNSVNRNISGLPHSNYLRSSLSTKHLLTRSLHFTRHLKNEIKVITVPQLAESLSEGDIRWEKNVGDQVAEDDVICEVETDKTSVPVHAPSAGVIEELLVEDGATVQPGMQICKLRLSSGGAAAAAKPAPAESEPKPAPAASEPKPAPESRTPPLTEEAVSAAIPVTPPPVPPKPAGPVSSIPVSSVKISPVQPPSTTAEAPGTAIAGTRTEQRVKMNRMRQRIAQRLKEAQNTYAMLTTFNEIDMSSILELRNAYKDAFLKKHNIKLGFMSAFVRASVFALQDQPIVNAVIDENEIVYRDYIDISVAVATPKGLVVPVIRNVEKMNFADIEKAIFALGQKAQTGSLAIEDMDGGTFTISNGGVFGSLYGTPIINPPQSAILGMHAIQERPVAIKGKVEIKPMMYVALTYDHRLIDGREAVLFLRKIKAAVEDPQIMFLDI